MVHLIRNTFRLASRRDWDAMARELRLVYTAPTEAAAKERLGDFHAAWGETYPAIQGLWDNAWAEFVPFLEFPAELRRIVYTTNSIESLNARMRRATRAVAIAFEGRIFPHHLEPATQLHRKADSP